mmetsp:Transcript_33711/g.80022  ORF Transcript_33711/g.80022 Transcript_33711/m.80022 type:complete len:218 (-) Transcript_33711:32-685(-)
MVAEQQAPDVPLDGCLNLGGPHMHPLACGAQLCGRRDRDRGRKPPRVYLLRGLRPLRAGQGNHGAGLRRVRVWDADDPPAHPPALPWVHLQRLLDVLRFRLRHHPTAVVCFPRAGDPEPGGHLRGRVTARQEDAKDAQPRHRRHSRALMLLASSPPTLSPSQISPPCPPPTSPPKPPVSHSFIRLLRTSRQRRQRHSCGAKLPRPPPHPQLRGPGCM